MSTTTLSDAIVADIDDLAPITIERGIVTSDVQPVADSTPYPTEAEALAAAVPFDQEFSALDDDGRTQLRAIGSEAHDLIVNPSAAARYVKLGAMIHNFLVYRFNALPAKYDRAAALKLVDTTLRIFGVPESFRADHLLAIFHLVKVERSTKDETGLVTYANDAASSDWFGGNISYRVLYLLRGLISRTSEKNAIDCWWYVDGLGVEQAVHAAVERLRKGELSFAQVKVIVAYHQDRIAAEAKAKADAGKTAKQLEDAETRRLQKEHDAKFTKLNGIMNDAQAFAADELAMDKDGLTAHLVNRGVIANQYGRPNMAALAWVITPGEAKEFIQSLEARYMVDPSRRPVMDAIRDTMMEIVKSRNVSTQQTKEHAAALKVAG